MQAKRAAESTSSGSQWRKLFTLREQNRPSAAEKRTPRNPLQGFQRSNSREGNSDQTTAIPPSPSPLTQRERKRERERTAGGGMEAAMDLMRRMPPRQSETALSALIALLPHHSADLLSQADQPLQVLFDAEAGKEFILCEYNRDADSYRSPWSNKYHPPLEDGPLPSAKLRKLEIEANDVFTIYRDQYYEGGVSSVYMWEDDSQGLVACFLIKKDGSRTGHGRRGHLQEGAWDAIHVIEVEPEEEGTAHYRLTSTIMLSLTTEEKSSGTFNLSGSIRREMSVELSLADGHLSNMGKMIEEMEGKLRNSLEQVYFGKTREMVCTLRPPPEGIQPRMVEN